MFGSDRPGVAPSHVGGPKVADDLSCLAGKPLGSVMFLIELAAGHSVEKAMTGARLLGPLDARLKVGGGAFSTANRRRWPRGEPPNGPDAAAMTILKAAPENPCAHGGVSANDPPSLQPRTLQKGTTL